MVSALFTGGQNSPGGHGRKDMDDLLTSGRGELNVDRRKAIYDDLRDLADDVRSSGPSPTRSCGLHLQGGRFYINSQSRPFVELREMTVQK